jgi:Pentapeptide repeats (8 copies)
LEQERTRREPAHDLVNLLVPDWRPTASQVLWGIRIAIGLIVLLGISSLIGDQYDKTVWDSAQLLLTASIPVVIAIVGNRYIQQRTQDDALQKYLDQMGELLLRKENPLRQSKEGEEVRTLARARTLTVLETLQNRKRKRSLLLFLHEAKLINGKQPVISLAHAELRGAWLWLASLPGANLTKAHLHEADLHESDLQHVDLSDAVLKRADLRKAKLHRANLHQAYLEGANLEGATVSQEQLNSAFSLDGATMPDGSKHD